MIQKITEDLNLALIFLVVPNSRLLIAFVCFKIKGNIHGKMMMSFFQGTGSFEENRSKNFDNWDL